MYLNIKILVESDTVLIVANGSLSLKQVSGTFGCKNCSVPCVLVILVIPCSQNNLNDDTNIKTCKGILLVVKELNNHL